MITFDFEYYRPDSIEGAINIFKTLKSSGKKTIFYGGGAEIINLAKSDKISFQAMIDLKSIPECNVLEKKDNNIVIGASASLTRICEFNRFPFLTDVIKGIADHTSRNKMTIGGNVCSTLHYNESVLPLLLCDAKVVIAGNNGKNIVPLSQMFNQNIALKEGEFLVQFIIDSRFVSCPYKIIKKTKNNQMEYPIVSISCLKNQGNIRAAFSGVCSFPFRSGAIEEYLNKTGMWTEEKINEIISNLPLPIVNDIQSSQEYRRFTLTSALKEILDSMEGIV